LRRSDGKYISDQYIRASIVEKNPLVLQRCSKELANFCINKFLKPDIIVGSQSGGIRVSAKVGELLRKESTYLEKSST
jgi:adenine/guanine phosphoribosyltransferase-like PRPP-binding protein